MKTKINVFGKAIFSIMLVAVLVLFSLSVVSAKTTTVEGKNDYVDGQIYIPFSGDYILGMPPSGKGQVSDTINLNKNQPTHGTLAFALNYDLKNDLKVGDKIDADNSYLTLTFFDLDLPANTNPSGVTLQETLGIVLTEDGPANPEVPGSYMLPNDVLAFTLSGVNYKNYQKGSVITDVNDKFVTYEIPLKDFEDNGLSLDEFLKDVNVDKEFAVVLILRADVVANKDISYSNTPEYIDTKNILFTIKPADKDLDCEEIDFNCDGRIDDEDKVIASDLYLDLLAGTKTLDEDLIKELRKDYDCDNFADYVEREWLNRDLTYSLFEKWNSLADRLIELEGASCKEGNRDHSPRFGYGATCEQEWVFSGWSACVDGSQTRVGTEVNQCNYATPYETRIEGRACEMPSVEEQPAKVSEINWLLVLMVAVAVVLILLIIILLFF